MGADAHGWITVSIRVDPWFQLPLLDQKAYPLLPPRSPVKSDSGVGLGSQSALIRVISGEFLSSASALLRQGFAGHSRDLL